MALMGLPTGLCIGPLPVLLRLLTQLTALQANYNSACLLRLNVYNDLAKAMKALDGKKSSKVQGARGQTPWPAPERRNASVLRLSEFNGTNQKDELHHLDCSE